MAGAMKKLMQVLGLDSGNEGDVTAEQAGLTDDEMGGLRERQQLDDLGMVPAPEKPAFNAAFVGPGGDVQRASNVDAAKSMADASATVGPMERQRAVREAMSLLGETARKHNLPGLFPTTPEQGDLMSSREQLGNAFDRVGVNPDEAPAAPQEQRQPAPVRSGASIAQKEQLADAFKRAGTNPEDAAAESLAERVGTDEPDPMQGASPDQKAQLAAAFQKAGLNPEQGGESGGPLGSAMKMVQGASDPRLAGLEQALKERNRLLKVADAEHEGGVGADIVAGTNFNAQAGAGTRARANAVVDSATEKLKQSRELGDFDTRQLDSTQRRQINLNADQRAAAGEQRAVSEEGRKQKAFDINAGRSDPNSAVSRNARAEAEVLYGQQWKRIPQETRDSFTADDVDRLFKEVSMKEMAGSARSGAQSAAQQKFDDQQLVDYEKNLVQPGTVDAYNRIAGRLEDPTPIYGMGTTAKAIGGALGSVPVMGKSLSSNWTQAFNSLTPEGQGLYQDAIRVMQQITLDTTGKAMNEQELNNIKARLGMAGGNENDFRNALLDELQAVQERAARQLAARNPRVQQRARDAGILPQWRKRGGGARPYALETEGRFNEADSEGGR
jgi:hypothetical protein